MLPVRRMVGIIIYELVHLYIYQNITSALSLLHNTVHDKEMELQVMGQRSENVQVGTMGINVFQLDIATFVG